MRSRSGNNMLISVHLPKTAGSSFMEELKAQFGARLVLDYEQPLRLPDFAANMRTLVNCGRNGLRRNQGAACIHGHFKPLKYSLSGMRAGAKFITWMRDPVERLASHYYFWMRETGTLNPSAFHRKIVAEKWPLERFCLSPAARNIYSRYLWGMPLDRFDFIGITEYYDSELDYFAWKYLPRPIRHYRVNANPGREERRYITDAALREKIAAYHRRDMLLYERALEMRSARLKPA